MPLFAYIGADDGSRSTLLVMRDDGAHNNPHCDHTGYCQRTEQIMKRRRLVAFMIVHRPNAKRHADDIHAPNKGRYYGPDGQANPGDLGTGQA